MDSRAHLADVTSRPFPGLRDLLRPRHPDRVASRSPRWHRGSLAALLIVTAALYLWGLGASGWANSFYSAAVEAGTRSWKAFLFGSFDSSNFITVDKPPASLWVMELSARVFGVNAWSILVPQALEGLAAVALVYAMVRRGVGHVAGLIAGFALAVTPVAVLMFRFNNPDPLLVLLLVGAAFATLRGTESGRTRWLVLAGVLVGFGFLTKMLQAFLVLPALGGVYLLAAPVSIRRRLVQTFAAALSVVVGAGWWVALVTLWPAADRPYIGGSTDNSILNLIFGYNGFGRLTGSETGSVGGGGASGSMWGPTGWSRLFNSDFGGQISWLMPAAVIFLAAMLWLRRGRPRTDRVRAAALLWGTWLLVTGLVLSFAQGIIHPYYTVALAPAIAALVGMGAAILWRTRDRLISRLGLSASIATSSIWSFVLLARSPGWMPWLRPTVLVVGLCAAITVIIGPWLSRRLVAAVAAAGMAAVFAGPVAYATDTATSPHTGAIPSAGPAVATSTGRGPGGGQGAPGGPTASPGGPAGFTGNPRGRTGAAIPAGQSPSAPGAGPRDGGGGGGALGGLLDAGTPSAVVVRALQQNSGSYTWVAATVGANNAAGYQLASGDAVMAIGGFNGTDQWPALAEFEQLVSRGTIHYFIAGGGFGGGPGQASGSTSAAITSWVEQTFKTTTMDGVTLYDLTSPA